ncbi:MAG: LapA family protein [Patescibacteria group bacterium]|jgi:uncharacterized integral membrane protein
MILSLFIGFILGAGALLFALQNTDIVALTFMGWQFSTSLAILVLASVIVGVLISILAYIPSALSASFRIMGLKKQNKHLVQELEAQRQTPTSAPATVEESSVIDLRS